MNDTQIPIAFLRELKAEKCLAFRNRRVFLEFLVLYMATRRNTRTAVPTELTARNRLEELKAKRGELRYMKDAGALMEKSTVRERIQEVMGVLF